MQKGVAPSRLKERWNNALQWKTRSPKNAFNSFFIFFLSSVPLLLLLFFENQSSMYSMPKSTCTCIIYIYIYIHICMYVYDTRNKTKQRDGERRRERREGKGSACFTLLISDIRRIFRFVFRSFTRSFLVFKRQTIVIATCFPSFFSFFFYSIESRDNVQREERDYNIAREDKR